MSPTPSPNYRDVAGPTALYRSPWDTAFRGRILQLRAVPKTPSHQWREQMWHDVHVEENLLDANPGAEQRRGTILSVALLGRNSVFPGLCVSSGFRWVGRAEPARGPDQAVTKRSSKVKNRLEEPK